MAKLSNIIQRRELEPLLHKAFKVVKYYEKAANCAAYVMEPGGDTEVNQLCSFCKHCNLKSGSAAGKISCYNIHKEAVNKARMLGGLMFMCARKVMFSGQARFIRANVLRARSFQAAYKDCKKTAKK